MREASGNTFVFYMILIFILIIIALIVGSLSYSKAYKVKNFIVNTIQEDEGWNDGSRDKIAASLNSIGYRNSTVFKQDDCNDFIDHVSGVSAEIVYPTYGDVGHTYCVIEYELGANGEDGKYYEVVTFMHFDIPIIGRFLEFPVSGQTKIMDIKYENIEV